MAIATSIVNVTGGLPQNPGTGNTAVGESSVAFDTTLKSVKVFDGSTLYELPTTVSTTARLAKDSTEVVTTTNIITAAESGTTFFLNSATEFVSTLPAPAAGLYFRFIVSAAPSGADYTIVTTSGTDLIHGAAVSSADAGGSVDSTAGTAADTITFVGGQSLKGDWVEVLSDGTSWYAFGVCSDEDAITFTQS